MARRVVIGLRLLYQRESSPSDITSQTAQTGGNGSE
jgi:hypothetical protein